MTLIAWYLCGLIPLLFIAVKTEGKLTANDLRLALPFAMLGPYILVAMAIGVYYKGKK